jgi:hypothetical protein
LHLTPQLTKYITGVTGIFVLYKRGVDCLPGIVFFVKLRYRVLLLATAPLS